MDQSSPLLSLKNELLLNAIIRGDLPTAKRLIDRHGAQVNSENNAGISSLQLAIVNQHSKLAEYLIQKGADIFKRDSKGWTALHDAALADNIIIAKKLLSKGMSPMNMTDHSELVIDVAGSPQMELLLCEEMCKVGEVELAKQYYKYLGLNQLGSQSTSHNSFSKGTRGNLCSPQVMTKNGQLSNTKSTQFTHSATLSSIPSSTVNGCNKLPVGSAMTLKFAPGHGHMEHFVSTGNLTSKPLTESHASAESALNDIPVEQGHTREAKQSQTTKQLPVTDTPYESNQPSAREESAINALYTHSGFQLEIGLSLLNIDSQATSLDSEFDSQRVINSPRVRTHRKAARTQSDPVFQDPLKAQFQNPRPGRKVSFSVLPMTKTKLSSTDLPIKTNPNMLMEEQSSPTDLSSNFSVPEAALQQLSNIYNRDGSSSDEEIEKAGMRALRKKPRKSSIVSPQRRRSSVERRKSVSFQPEVLLHQNVLSGDVKAVSDMLESGIIMDVNTMSPAGLTALHQSAIDGNLDCAKTLIKNKANVNCTDCEQWTPLHAAAVTGQANFVRYLLLSGADANLKNDNGDTAYDVTKDIQIRKMLLHSMNGKSPDSNDFSDAECFSEEEREYSHAESDSDDEVNSPELFGTRRSNPSLKERLGLKHSTAFANNQDSSILPSSPNLEAADSIFVNSDKITNKPQYKRNSTNNSNRRNNQSGYQAGNDDDGDGISEDQGICTMDGSSDCSHRSRILSEDEGTTRDVLDSDLVPGSLDYRFQEACLNCAVDALLKLVKHKAEINVNRVNVNSGVTALHHAVLEENFALTQHLITDFDANVHIQDRDGWTPLHAASAVGDLRTAQLLLDNGAKASILNSSCEFPVDVASDEAVEKLLKNAMLGPGVGTLFQGILTR